VGARARTSGQLGRRLAIAVGSCPPSCITSGRGASRPAPTCSSTCAVILPKRTTFSSCRRLVCREPRPFVERFGERLLIFLNEDIRADAHAIYRRALKHVDVDATFIPENLAEVRYSTPVPAESKYHSTGGRRTLTNEERLALWPYFAEDVQRLEGILGRNLSHWRPPASTSS
jgi:hypothetical protein